MRILITNDDGILAPGLALAEAIVAEAFPEAEVWVVAPEGERSGVGHAISYTTPLRYVEIGERRYAVDGYPADCVLLGLFSLLRDTPPDLVLSGVNQGHNIAEDVFYSGTIGAAMEAALAGVPALAFSQFYTTQAGAPADIWDPARAHGAETLRRTAALPAPRGIFHNVNFPAVHPDKVRGVVACAHGIRREATFDVVPHVAPNGRRYHYFRHMTKNDTAPEGSDARLLLDGHITLTPVRCDLTAHDLVDALRPAFG